MSCSLQVQLSFLLSCLIWRSSSLCYTDQFACLDGSKCIPVLWLCDGARDCPDGSDEKHSKCHPHLNNLTCFGNQPECLHGGVARCIPNEWLCDGHKDCDNGEDEANCNGSGRVTEANGCGPGKHSCEGKCVPLEQRCEDSQSIYTTSTTKNIGPTVTTADIISSATTVTNILLTTTTAKDSLNTATTAKDIITSIATAGIIIPTATTTKYTAQTTSTSKQTTPPLTTSKIKPKSAMMKVEHSPNEAKEPKSPQPIVPIVSYAGNERLPDIHLYNVKSLKINKTEEIPFPTLMPELTSPEPGEQPTNVTNPSSESEAPKKVVTNNLSLTSLAKVFRTHFPAFDEPVDVRRAPEKPMNPAKRQADPSSEANKTREEIIYDLAEEKQPDSKMEKSDETNEAKKQLSAVQEPIKPAPNPVRSIVVDPIKPVNA